MKIGLVNGGHPSDRVGGSELQTWLIGDALGAIGEEIHYFAVNASTAKGLTTEAMPTMSVHRFGTDVPLGTREEVLEARVKALGIEVLYVRIFEWLPAVLGIGRRLDIPVVLNLASELDLVRASTVSAILRPRELRKRLRHNRAVGALRHAGHVVAQTHEQEERARALGVSRVTVIRNVFPAPPVCEPSTEERVVWVGSLKPVKRPELFMELARRLEGHAAFVIVGAVQDESCGGVLRESVAGGWVEFRGELSVEEAWCEIARASLLVNTSLHEGFANTFIQAWMVGVPVMTLGIDPDHILSERGIGCVAPDMRGLIQEVDVLLADPERRRAMGERGRRYAEQEHGLERGVQRYRALFASVVARRGESS